MYRHISLYSYIVIVICTHIMLYYFLYIYMYSIIFFISPYIL